MSKLSSVTHNIGSFEHIYATKNLKLNTQALVTLSSLDALHFPFSNVFGHIDSLLTAETWITAGTNFKLNLSLHFDDISIEGKQASSLVDELGLSICNAEVSKHLTSNSPKLTFFEQMWSQLDLRPSLSILTDGLKPATNIALTLTPCHIISNLGTNVRDFTLPEHLKPPQGVPSAWLGSVDLYLKFSCYPTLGDTIRKRKRDSEQVRNDSKSTAHLACARRDYEGHIGFIPTLFSHMSQSNWSSDMTSRNLRATCIDINSTSSLSELPSLITPLNSNSGVSSPRSYIPETQKVGHFSTPFKDHIYHAQSIEFAELIELIDCSLKGIICSPQAASFAYLLSSVTDCSRLDQISPAIFSPGYVQATSHRAHLLSDIASIIVGIYRRSTNVALARKIRWLEDIPMERYLPSSARGVSHDGSEGTPNLNAVKAKIWFLLQRELYDKRACKRLKPLDASREGKNVAVASKEMLDDCTLGSDQMTVQSSSQSHHEEDSTNVESKFSRQATLFDDVSLEGGSLESMLEDDLRVEEIPSEGTDGLEYPLYLEDPTAEEMMFGSLEVPEDPDLIECQSDEDLFWTDIESCTALADDASSPSQSFQNIDVESVTDELLDDTAKSNSQSYRMAAEVGSLWEEDLEHLLGADPQADTHQDPHMITGC